MEKNNKQLKIWISEKLLEKVRKFAGKKKESIGEVVRQAISSYLK